MAAEIPDFDETDFKALQAMCAGKSFGSMTKPEIESGIDILLAKIGVITGVEIPANINVYKLLKHEIGNSILTTKRYAVLTLNEFEQAFLMTANGDLGEIKDWGKSLNLKFFFDIVNKYCSYKAAFIYKFLEWQDNTKRKLLLPAAAKVENNYELTESAYQEFLTGKYNPLSWYYRCYDDLVKCGWVEPEFYQKMTKKARSVLIKEKHLEIMSLEKKSGLSKKDHMPVNIGKYMQAINGLTDIRNEKEAKKIEIISKQLAMEAYFKHSAIGGEENLFVPAPTENNNAC